MPLIQSSKPEGGSFEKKQGVLLPKRSVYGAIFARYTMPKVYESKFGPKEKMGFGFVITHDQAYREMPEFCDSFRLIPNTIFHDPNKLTSSLLVEFLYAFKAGKASKAEIAATTAYDYDEFVGRPVLLLAEPGDKPDANGIYYNNIAGIDPIDKEMYAAMKPLLSKIEYGTNEKTGLKFVKSPTGGIMDEPVDIGGSTSGSNLGFEDEIPF